MSAFEAIDDTSLVLVAIIPNQRDLEIARLLGWYRIPLKNAPKVIAVDYLALYQTGSFGATERWQIKWLAPIVGHELTTRQQLFRDQPDHPRANEEYFKLQLGSLIELPEPIPAGSWKRVTFFYTTMRHVREAENLATCPCTIRSGLCSGQHCASVPHAAKLTRRLHYRKFPSTQP